MESVKFQVEADVADGDHVLVTGNCEELGSWHPVGALLLQQSTTDKRLWSGQVSVSCPLEEVFYRYFIGKVHEPYVDLSVSAQQDDTPDIQKRVVTVSSWEVSLDARNYKQSEHGTHTVTDNFGEIGNHVEIRKGWLTEQTEFRFRFHSSPLHLWKQDVSSSSFSVKCRPLDLSREVSEENSPTTDFPVEVAGTDHGAGFHSQPPDGSVSEEGSYLTIKVQSLQPMATGYELDVCIPPTQSKITAHSMILPSHLVAGSQGLLKLPLVSFQSKKVIGQLTVDYLTISPCEMRDNERIMEVCFANHYLKRHQRPLDVGHRGSGKCRDISKSPFIKENTVLSFNQAGIQGADFVEFDVQLTKDKVPVVFHDFQCRLSCLHNLGATKYGTHDVAVQDLTLENIRKLQVGFAVETGTADDHGAVHEAHLDMPSTSDPGEQLFPLLNDVFDQVDSNLGFNIELKFCMRLKETGELEDGLQYYFDRNDVVDAVLSIVLKHAGEREIVFSSFDPDICTILCVKQARYPVLFLTQGQTERYPHYQDPRTWDIPAACKLAVEEGFLGVNPHTEDILKDAALLDLIHKHNLTAICWGNDNNDKGVIQYLIAQGAAAVCYDRIHELKGAQQDNVQENRAQEDKVQGAANM